MFIYILFILGFLILIKGADLLVLGSASIAKRLNISNIVIGLTIVAFGTSMPEFIVNIFASVNGNTEIAIGNILGSNIANILLILGISSMIYPLVSKRNTVLKEIPFSLLAVIVLSLLVNDIKIDNAITSILTRIDGLILISFFIVFLYYIFSIAKNSSQDNKDESEIIIYTKKKSILYILIGLMGLIFGGKFIVDGSVKIAEIFNLSESLIGLTIVAIGTSLPELATSAVAAYKKHTDIAIGNIVGSNIFNIFFILGISSIIRPLPFNSNSNIDIYMLIFSSLILFIFMFIGKKHVIQKWQGLSMIIIYLVYIIILINIK